MLAGLLLAHACVRPSGAPPEAAPVGCYRFDQAYFPVIGRDTGSGVVVSRSTAELALLDAPPPPDFVMDTEERHAVRPIPFGVDTFTVRRWMSRSGWTSLPGDSVQVVWRNGLFGPVFRLARHGDSLSGTVVHTTDVLSRAPLRGSATAVCIACPAAASWR